MFRDASEAAPANVAQNGILARKITEKSWLADFENLDDIIDAGVFVAAFAEQPKGSVDDPLAQARFLAFAKAGYWPARSSLALAGASAL